jgi:predicted deacylase
MNLVDFFDDKNKYAVLKNGFLHATKMHGGMVHDICNDTKNNKIFGCELKNSVENPKLAIVSGLHGDEPGGPYGMLDFFSQKKLPNIGLLLLPVLNPFGLIRNNRKDDMNRDLNRAWDKNDRKIVKKVKNIILDFKPDLLLSLHEDQNADGYYMYKSKNADESIVRFFCDELNKDLIPASGPTIYGDEVEDGVIRNTNQDKPKHAKSLELFFEKNHIPNITLELPSTLPLIQRKKIYCDLLTGFCKAISA